MGLDMYLEKKTYVQNWEHTAPQELHKITVKRGNKIRKDIKPERISYIVEQVAYWRKANAIHAWFVINVMDGNDDCNEHYVENEQLESLLKAVNIVLAGCELMDGQVVNGYSFDAKGIKINHFENGKVIKDASIARNVLPTLQGFFFGSTEYDQYYIDDLKYTKDILEKILAEENQSSYYYRASW